MLIVAGPAGIFESNDTSTQTESLPYTVIGPLMLPQASNKVEPV
jgi:hypothetical protein